jgi:hypothetical protein
MRDIYERFVVERHQVWEKRQLDLPAPWTWDPILVNYKFTNVFRILDAGTQFLVKELQGRNFHQDLMSSFLYRYTNRPEPWIAFAAEFGGYPTSDDLVDGTLLEFWREYREAGGAIFGNAYKMFSGLENKGTDRLTWAVNLARDWFGDMKFSDHLRNAQGPPQYLFNRLHTIPRCADFMAMQILTDIGYSQFLQADENEFIVPGPGAKVGAKLVAPGTDPTELIQELTVFWAEEGSVTLYGRTPSLMDVQNTLCEFGKYARYLSLVKVRDSPYLGSGPTPEPFIPEHWKGTV